MLKIATIGFFDGVHRGHRFLFAQLHEQAKLLHLTPVIYTFREHPKQFLTGEAPAMLTTYAEREERLKTFGEIHFLVRYHPDQNRNCKGLKYSVAWHS